MSLRLRSKETNKKFPAKSWNKTTLNDFLKHLKRVNDICQLKQCLIEDWSGLQQTIVNEAIDEWRRRLCGLYPCKRTEVWTLYVTSDILTFSGFKVRDWCSCFVTVLQCFSLLWLPWKNLSWFSVFNVTYKITSVINFWLNGISLYQKVLISSKVC